MLKYIIWIMLMLLSWVVTSDISFAGELMKPEECTKELPKISKEESQVLKSLEKVGEVVWNYKYSIMIALVITATIAVTLVGKNDIISTLEALPDPANESWKIAVEQYPELAKGIRSTAMPPIIDVKGSIWLNTNGDWEFIKGLWGKDGNVYRLYMDYDAVPADLGTIFKGIPPNFSFVATNVVAVNALTLENAPYLLVELVHADSAKHAITIVKVFLIRI